MLPKLFHILGAADTDQLQAFKVCAFRQKHIRHVVGFIVGIRKANSKREIGNCLFNRSAVPE